MEKGLSAADRSRAEAEAAKILEQMLKRNERFVPAKPVEFGRGSAGARAEWVAWQADYRHECQWNLKSNCRGAQRVTYVELISKNAEFLSCKIEMRARDFVTGAPVAEPLSRQVLIGPQATRSVLLGDVNGDPDKKGLVATCTPVPKLAANASAGKCRARLQGSVDVERYYPESAQADTESRATPWCASGFPRVRMSSPTPRSPARAVMPNWTSRPLPRCAARSSRASAITDSAAPASPSSSRRIERKKSGPA